MSLLPFITLLGALAVTIWLLLLLLFGFTLTTQLVPWTILRLRLTISIAVLPLISVLNMSSSARILSGRSLTAGLLNINIELDRFPFTLSVSPSCRVLLLERSGALLFSARQFSFRPPSILSCRRIIPKLVAVRKVAPILTLTNLGREQWPFRPPLQLTLYVLPVHWELPYLGYGILILGRNRILRSTRLALL